MIEQKIQEYDPEKSLKQFRREIVQSGFHLLDNLQTNYNGECGHYALCSPLSRTIVGDLDHCLAEMDELILDDPYRAQSISITPQESRTGHPFGIIHINLVKRTIAHSQVQKCCACSCVRGRDSSAVETPCELLDLAAKIATYYAERVRRSIDGFAKLDQILRGEQKWLNI